MNLSCPAASTGSRARTTCTARPPGPAPGKARVPSPTGTSRRTAEPAPGPAADFIADQVKKNPGKVPLFVLGPATDIALAVKTHPEIVPLVKEVIYMGGAFDTPGNVTPGAEFNRWFDPEAAKIVLRTPFKKQIIVPHDVALKVAYGRAQYDRVVTGAETPIKKMFKDVQRGQGTFVRDAIAAGVFLDRTLVKRSEERYIDPGMGPDYGRSLGYNLGESKAPGNPAGTRKATIVFEVDTKRFWDLYVDTMRNQ
ncbi:nucleoside hydrolase [Streptosporangium vulgare]|uniref:Nucleoside hydrolase n=1 Tax=Streptosporangium vulgare TaxID=46190 RepID=A0ABV5TQZ6_9ACTN